MAARKADELAPGIAAGAAISSADSAPSPAAARSSVHQPSVSVIIVTFNSAATIAACLDSLARVDRPPFETIVIDNASADVSADLVARAYPRVRLIRERENTGFAAAAVAAARASSGDVVVLLNPDAVVEANWLDELVAGLMSDESIGLAGCKIFEADGKTLQHAGGWLGVNALSGHRGRGEIDRGQYDEMCDVEYATGAALAVRRSTLQKHGFFDPEYRPAYYEEAELAVRHRRAGLRVVYVPRARLTHVEAASSGKFSESFYLMYHRSRIRFVMKTSSLSEFVCRFVPAEVRWIARNLPSGSAVPLARAWAWNLAVLPSTLLRRRRGEQF